MIAIADITDSTRVWEVFSPRISNRLYSEGFTTIGSLTAPDVTWQRIRDIRQLSAERAGTVLQTLWTSGRNLGGEREQSHVQIADEGGRTHVVSLVTAIEHPGVLGVIADRGLAFGRTAEQALTVDELMKVASRDTDLRQALRDSVRRASALLSKQTHIQWTTDLLRHARHWRNRGNEKLMSAYEAEAVACYVGIGQRVASDPLHKKEYERLLGVQLSSDMTPRQRDAWYASVGRIEITLVEASLEVTDWKLSMRAESRAAAFYPHQLSALDDVSRIADGARACINQGGVGTRRYILSL